jgi:hypothetical protein
MKTATELRRTKVEIKYDECELLTWGVKYEMNFCRAEARKNLRSEVNHLKVKSKYGKSNLRRSRVLCERVGELFSRRKSMWLMNSS